MIEIRPSEMMRSRVRWHMRRLGSSAKDLMPKIENFASACLQDDYRWCLTVRGLRLNRTNHRWSLLSDFPINQEFSVALVRNNSRYKSVLVFGLHVSCQSVQLTQLSNNNWVLCTGGSDNCGCIIVPVAQKNVKPQLSTLSLIDLLILWIYVSFRS